jgi:hypothetical protein
MSRRDFSKRQERKKERLQKRAENAKREADQAYEATDRIAKSIPFGQPILVGHHSERGHRADLKRIDRGMRKAIEKNRESEELLRRAEVVGTGGISSDDPEAVAKLGSKLELLLQKQDFMKRLNAAWRTAGKPEPYAPEPTWEQIQKDAKVDAEALQQVRRDMARRWAWQPGAPFPAYALSNLSSEIRRVRTRIGDLQRSTERPAIVQDAGPCQVIESVAENRIQLVFPGKPPDATRALLKARGFRWSPTAGAWQRLLNDAGRLAARLVVDQLQPPGGDQCST